MLHFHYFFALITQSGAGMAQSVQAVDMALTEACMQQWTARQRLACSSGQPDRGSHAAVDSKTEARKQQWTWLWQRLACS